MILRPVRLLLGLALLGTAGMLPAQRPSDSYEFLKAVREANGAKVQEYIDKPGSLIVNTKDRDTGESALHIAAKRGDVTYTRFFLGKGANLNAQDARGNTALMLATTGGYAELVDLLTKLKANVNLANQQGETPLIRAVQLRNADLVRILLAAGANADQRDVIAGMSARDYAVRDARNPAITKMLADAPKVQTRAVAGPTLR